MRITDAFLGEHGVLYALFDHIEAELGAGSDPTAHAGLLRTVLHAHARAEDELLFDEMAGRPHGAGGPAGAMMEEHRQVSALLDRSARAGGDELRDLLREIMDLARTHFRREEEAAFPLAEELLDAGRLQALGAEWGARRAVQLRGGSHG